MAGRRLRILYHALVEFDTSDGHALHTREICQNLAALGNDVIFIGPRPRGPVGFTPAFRIRGVPFFGYTLFRRLIYFCFLCLRLLSAVIRYKPDVIIDKNTPFNLITEIIGTVFGIQVANEINGFGPDEAEGRGGAIGAARIAVERLKFRSSKLLVAVSPFLAGRYAGYYGINPGKFRIVDNGVAEHFFKPADGTRVRQKFGFAADDFALGYVGSFNPDHDFETMLAVIGKLKAKGRKVRGLFCGKGARLEEARETAKHLGVENEVSFPGPIPYEEVPEYLAAFDCAAILMEPRRAGALASVMKLKEYLAAGVPVLSSDFTGDDAGLSEFVFQGGIRDEEKAANTAERIAADREGAREKARRGREFVRGRFSWRNTARQYEDALFGRAACGKPAACARRKP